MSNNLKIAIIQLYPKPLDQEGNFSKAANYIREAASQGAKLAVLPEYHLSGWEPQAPEFVAQSLKWKEYLKLYQGLAKEYSINIVPGTIVQHMGNIKGDDGVEKAVLHNVAYFIGEDGEVLGSYQKKNLWHPERPHLTPSKEDPHEMISTPLGPVGLLICWDIAFPEAFRELVLQGAKIIIAPAFWLGTDATDGGLELNPNSEELFVSSVLTSRAFENTCCVVFVNAGGPKAANYLGRSRVTVPFLGPVNDTKDPTKPGGGGEESMDIVEVDLSILDEAEKSYKIREDLAKDDWHYTYSRTGRK